MKSLMDIIQDKSTELTSPDSQSLTPAVVEEKADVIKRLEAGMEFLTKGIIDSPTTSRKAKFMFSKLWEEAILELQEVPPELVEQQFASTTALMYWISTGQIIENVPMPEGFWDHVGATIPSLATIPAPLELEAGVTLE